MEGLANEVKGVCHWMVLMVMMVLKGDWNEAQITTVLR